MQDNDNGTTSQGQVAEFDDVKLGAIRVALIFSFCLFMASHSVPALVPTTLHSLLLFAASLSALIAGLRMEHPMSSLFTRWDEALILLFLAFVSLKFVDVEAARLALESLGATVPAVETPLPAADGPRSTWGGSDP